MCEFRSYNGVIYCPSHYLAAIRYQSPSSCCIGCEMVVNKSYVNQGAVTPVQELLKHQQDQQQQPQRNNSIGAKQQAAACASQVNINISAERTGRAAVAGTRKNRKINLFSRFYQYRVDNSSDSSDSDDLEIDHQLKEASLVTTSESEHSDSSSSRKHQRDDNNSLTPYTSPSKRSRSRSSSSSPASVCNSVATDDDPMLTEHDMDMDALPAATTNRYL